MSDSKDCHSLHNLLHNNTQAKEYYMGLPDYVQGMLRQRTYEIHTEEELKKYSEVLLNSY